MSENFSVDRETAERDFDRMVAAMRVMMKSFGDENEQRDKEADREAIIYQIMLGNASVDDEGRLSYTTGEGDTLTFKKPKGAAMAAIDRVKETKKVAQGYAILAELTGKAPVFFVNLDQYDVNVCLAVMTLFLVQ